jgi:cytochrome c biogenesis protein CcmG/thiol:disulfide interchange protein DsbE
VALLDRQRGQRSPRRVGIFLLVVSLVIVVAYAVYAASLASSPSPTSHGQSLLSLSRSQLEGTSPLVGKPVPAFSLPLIANGGAPASGTVSPRQYLGHPLVINFFASWCTSCAAETPMVASEARALAGKVQFLGVDENDRTPNALAFIARDRVDYPVVRDAGSLQGSYLLVGLPTTVFVDPSGRVAGVVQGGMTRGVLRTWINRIS